MTDGSEFVANGNNKERMEKTEIAKILEWHNSGTLKTHDAVERICSLFNVVGQSEQLKAFAQWCYDKGYADVPDVYIEEYIYESL